MSPILLLEAWNVHTETVHRTFTRTRRAVQRRVAYIRVCIPGGVQGVPAYKTVFTPFYAVFRRFTTVFRRFLPFPAVF